ncbi:MAG: excinuclease ABC subunit UvrA, partial [Alphaproteobacteria bacterium]
VITGLSGSGKSSLAFDTVYAEGQRRYVESLSAYARQFLEMQNKPDVESITGLSPAIAIDQKTTSKNPRSTVATITEIYDYLRLLYARVGVPYSPATGKPIERQSVSQMVEKICSLPEKAKIYLLSPIVRGGKGEHRSEIEQLEKDGYNRIKIDNNLYEIDKIPEFDKNKKHDISVVIDRLVVSPTPGNRLASSVETALELSKGLLAVEIVALDDEFPSTEYKKGDVLLFSEHYSCPVSGFQLPKIEPRIFSFNSPYGACPTCNGLGTQLAFDTKLIIPDENLSLIQGAIKPWSNSKSKFFEQMLLALSKQFNFDATKKYRELSNEVKQLILFGSGEEKVQFEYEDGFKILRSNKPFEGIVNYLNRKWKEAENDSVRELLEKYQNLSDCLSCNGYRLKPETLCVKIDMLHIGEVCKLTVDKFLDWLATLPEKFNKTQNQIAEKILQELSRRTQFLKNVGLDYITLARKSGTLSGGESQRIRLASQIGSGLSGVLYVLDEPSIGLHQCDNDKLLTTLRDLRDLNNTVIVVEHDEDTMRSADYLIDMGLGAGIHGGHIIAEGKPDDVANSKESITGAYLSGRKFIPIPQKRPFNSKRVLKISGVTTNNLQNVTAEIPLKAFTSITGVSGGGKSSLIIHTLQKALSKLYNGTKALPGPYKGLEGLEHLDKVIDIDQSPIGKTPRSNPATYVGVFNHVRDLYTLLPESKARGYKPGRFSFNVKGGRCETCQGDGMILVEMHFLPDVYVVCEECNGKRYNRETLEIKYKGKTISDILEMTVEEGEQFFAKIPVIYEKLACLKEVGLGYIKIGQSATTLSGGEAQRVKLAKELSKKSTGRTLYILDEPTTGLHSDDIYKLLRVLHKLVEAGNTVLVIEHNLDVIKTSDWVIDIGPGGGDKGGRIVAFGTPEDITKVEESITGRYLKRLLRDDHRVETFG